MLMAQKLYFTIAAACLLFVCYLSTHQESATEPLLSIRQCPRNACVITKHLSSRDVIGDVLEKCQLEIGAELGVQEGIFSASILDRWKNCKRFYLVDPWAQQTNYKDGANVNDSVQEKRYEKTKLRLAPWVNKTTFHRMTTKEAAPNFEENSLDFIYIDARHDYCAVKEDIEMYWPKVRCGGIFAGHDYAWAETKDKENAVRDYEICENGERHPGGAKRAVDEFANKHNLSVMELGGATLSWLIMKP